MRTRTIVLALIAAFVLTTPVLAADYGVDPAHSGVLFRVQHKGAGPFYGRFNDVQGKVSFDAADAGSISVEVKVKADSIDTNNAKRDQHLKGPDFFNVKQFPWITFKSSSCKKTGEGKFDLTGTLALHGVKKEITVPFEIVGDAGDLIGAEAIFTIKRSEFGIDYMPGGLGEEVRMIVAIEAQKS